MGSSSRTLVIFLATLLFASAIYDTEKPKPPPLPYPPEGQNPFDDPIQVSRLVRKNDYSDIPLEIEQTLFVDQANKKGYSSLSACLHEPTIRKDGEDAQVLLPQCEIMHYNQTNLLQGCEIQIDSVNLALHCQQSFYFASLFQLYKTSALQTQQFSLRVDQMPQTVAVSSDEAILGFSQSEYLMCYYTRSFLQCQQTAIGLLFEQIFMKDDDEIDRRYPSEKSNGNNVQSILGIAQLSTSSDRSVIVVVIGDSMLPVPEESLQQQQQQQQQQQPRVQSTFKLITIHAEKEQVDFVSQQTSAQYPVEQLGSNSNDVPLKFRSIKMQLNQVRGSLTAVAFFEHSVNLFEIQAGFKSSQTPEFRQRIDWKQDSHLIACDSSNNMISLLLLDKNLGSCSLVVYRVTEYSYEVQKVLEKTYVCPRKETSEILLRMSFNRKSNEHQSSKAYLIHIIDQEQGEETVVALSEFAGEQQYLPPVHSVLRDRVKLDFNATINEQDIPKGISVSALEKQQLLRNSNIRDAQSNGATSIRPKIVDMQVVNVAAKNFILYSTDVALFFKPLCFHNSVIVQGKPFDRLAFESCKECPTQKFTRSINAYKCEERAANDQDIHPLFLVQFKETMDTTCSAQDETKDYLPKGPKCSTCSAFAQDFLSTTGFYENQGDENNTNFTIASSDAKLIEGSVVCAFECNNSSQNTTSSSSSNKVNVAGECIEESKLAEYNDFCSSISDCFACSFHPFCAFNQHSQKCMKLNYDVATYFFEEWQAKSSAEKAHSFLLMPFAVQKFEVCQHVKQQSFCQFSNHSARPVGSALEFTTDSSLSIPKKNTGLDGLITIDDEDDSKESPGKLAKPRFHKDIVLNKLEKVIPYQICSWLVINEPMYDDKQFLIRIATEEGFVKNQKEILLELSVCQPKESEDGPCKLSKIRTTLSEASIKRIRVLGGNFRLILQFQEDAEIDPSKIAMSYSMVATQNWHRIIIIITLGVILLFVGIILAVLFKNQILMWIRVYCNTLAFIDFEDDTQLNDLSVKRMMRKLEKEKLLVTNQRLGRKGIAPFFHTECSICLMSFNQDDLLCVLLCRHTFHQPCIEEWARVQFLPVTCPVCKTALTKEALNKSIAQQQLQQQQQQQRDTDVSLHNHSQLSIELQSHRILEIENENNVFLPDAPQIDPLIQHPQQDDLLPSP